MKKATLFSLALLAVFALVWLPACQNPESSSQQIDDTYYSRPQVPDLDDPYGGFNLADEDPAFGDQTLMSDFSGAEETPYDDPMEADPEVRDMDNSPAGRLFIRITWGNLERDSTINFATDWSGSLTVDRGAILLKRIIRFEPMDHVLPRTRRDLLEWVSHTGPAFDGVMVRVVPMPSHMGRPVLDDTTRVLTFSTHPLTVSFTLGELRDIHKVIPVDDAGNAVAFDAVYIVPGECPHGFLGGIWKDDPDTVGGVFMGKWISYDGSMMGHVRGFYGINSNGEHVFFGKYIDSSGRFMGILRGHYGRFYDGGPGFFAGIWLDRRLRIRGELKGIWMTSDRVDGGGFFAGGWRKYCRMM